MQFFNRAVAKLMPVSKAFTEALLHLIAPIEREFGRRSSHSPRSWSIKRRAAKSYSTSSGAGHAGK
ncbi:MAG: hypothetical protein R2912_07665 [Eubacteriales bacterium]